MQVQGKINIIGDREILQEKEGSVGDVRCGA